MFGIRSNVSCQIVLAMLCARMLESSDGQYRILFFETPISRYCEQKLRTYRGLDL